MNRFAVVMASMVVLTTAGAAHAAEQHAALGDLIADAQRKVVKIFGAGGAQRLEGYQTGLLVSGEGHVLTVWSYVLDGDWAAVVLHDGRRFEAELVGADPRTGIAVLRIPNEGEEFPYFRVADAPTPVPGDRVLALSNLYRVASGNEPVSVQHGVLSAIAPLRARRGPAPVQFTGDVYLLDAMTNNPGAAGGAVIDLEGRLIAMIGRELRSSVTNAWLNYGLPVDAFRESLDAIRAGRLVARATEDEQLRPESPWSLGDLGIVLVPDVLTNTPPFVDAIRPNTPAAGADIHPDDLVVLVEGVLVPSCRAVRETLALKDRYEPLRLTIVREGELIDLTFPVAP